MAEFKSMRFQDFIAKHVEKLLIEEGANLDTLNDSAQVLTDQYNSIPQIDFVGLSPDQMSGLLYQLLASDSPIKVCKKIPDHVLDSLPFFRLTETLIDIVGREKNGLILTKAGAMPRKVLTELYAPRFLEIPSIDWFDGKIRNESDYPVFESVKINGILSGMVRKHRGRLLLTEKGKRLSLPESRRDAFELVLKTFLVKFNWAYNDSFGNLDIIQRAAGFSIYLLGKLGPKTRNISEFSEIFLRAFPSSLPEAGDRLGWYKSPTDHFSACYYHRTFSVFFRWFGLADIKFSGGIPVPDTPVGASRLFDSIFFIDREGLKNSTL